MDPASLSMSALVRIISERDTSALTPDGLRDIMLSKPFDLIIEKNVCVFDSIVGSFDYKGHTESLVDAQVLLNVGQAAAQFVLQEFYKFDLPSSIQTSRRDNDRLFLFYLHLRRQCLLLLATILKSAGRADGSFHSVCRSLILPTKTLIESLLSSYSKLTSDGIPSQQNQDCYSHCADSVVHEQGLILQCLILAIHVEGSMPIEQLERIIAASHAAQFGTSARSFALLSESGRQSIACCTALWTQSLISIFDLGKIGSTSDSPAIGACITSATAQLDLDDRWFSSLGMIHEHGPPLFAWAVFVCVCNQSSTLSDDSDDDRREMQMRLLSHLRTAFSVDAFVYLRSQLLSLASQPDFHPVINIAKENTHIVVDSALRSRIFNIMDQIPNFPTTFIYPLYEVVLRDNPTLCRTLWQGIIESVSENSNRDPFPLFVHAWNRFTQQLEAPPADRDLFQFSTFAELGAWLIVDRLTCTQFIRIVRTISGWDTLIQLISDVVSFVVENGAFTEQMWVFISSSVFLLSRLRLHYGDFASDLIPTILRLLGCVDLFPVTSEVIYATRLRLVQSCVEFIARSLPNPKLLTVYSQISMGHLLKRALHVVELPCHSLVSVFSVATIVKQLLSQPYRDLVQHDDTASRIQELLTSLVDYMLQEVFVRIHSWSFLDKIILESAVCCILDVMMYIFDSKNGHLGIKAHILTLFSRMHHLYFALLQPLLFERDFSEITRNESTRIDPCALVSRTFSFLVALLQAKLDDLMGHAVQSGSKCLSEFEFILSNRPDSGRIVRRIASFLNGPSSCQSPCIQVLTSMCRIETFYGDRESAWFSLVGNLGPAMVAVLQQRCNRLLIAGKKSLSSCSVVNADTDAVLELLKCSLELRPVLAEKLFAVDSSGQSLVSDDSVWPQLKELLVCSNGPQLLMAVVRVLSALWKASNAYRAIASIAAFICKEWPGIWDFLIGCLSADTTPMISDDESDLQAQINVCSLSFGIFSDEMRRTEGKSKSLDSSDALPKLLSHEHASRWLSDLLPAWGRSLSSQLTVAYAEVAGSWKSFLQSVTFYYPSLCCDANLPNRIIDEISNRLCDRERADIIPQSKGALRFKQTLTLSMAALVPVATRLVTQSGSGTSHSTFDRLLDGLHQEYRVFLVQSKAMPTIEPAIKHMQFETLHFLLQSVLLAVPSRTDIHPSPVIFQVSLTLAADTVKVDSKSDLSLVLPSFLVKRARSSSDYLEALALPVAGSEINSTRPLRIIDVLLSTLDKRPESQGAALNLVAILQFVGVVADQPHVAEFLVQNRIFDHINNCWLAEFHANSSKMQIDLNKQFVDEADSSTKQRRNQVGSIWRSILLVVLAMIRSFGHAEAYNSNSTTAHAHERFLAQLGEFLAVYRQRIVRDLEVTSPLGQLSITIAKVQDMDLICAFLYEVARLPGRWSVVNQDLIEEHKRLIRFLAVVYSKLLADPQRLALCCHDQEANVVARTRGDELASASAGIVVSYALENTSSSLMVSEPSNRRLVSRAFLKHLELRLCVLLSKAISFLRVFAPVASDEYANLMSYDAIDSLNTNSIIYVDALFSNEISYRNAFNDFKRDAPLPMTFLVELADYCIDQLSSQGIGAHGSSSAAKDYAAAHKDEYESVQIYLLENALFLLITFSRAFICMRSIMHVDLIQDYVDTFQRLTMSCQSIDMTSIIMSSSRQAFFRDMFVQMTTLANRLSLSLASNSR